jgi:MFS family permease
VIESWLNVSTTNENRGKVFSTYSMIDIVGVTGSQFMLPFLGAESFVPFAVMAMMLAVSLVPMALSPTAQPAHSDTARLHIWEAWSISPLAFVACFAIGLTNSSFRTVGPLYAQGVGLDYTQIAVFMGLGIGGGAVLQIPFGWLSDRMDRRTVLLIATAGAAIAALILSVVTGPSVGAATEGGIIFTKGGHELIYAGIFLFGAFAMPLYSLAATHAADFAKPGQYAALSGALLFTFAAGSMVGPLVAAYAVEVFGPRALFSYTGLVHALLIAWTLIRKGARPTVPWGERVKHMRIIKTMTAPDRPDVPAESGEPAKV